MPYRRFSSRERSKPQLARSKQFIVALDNATIAPPNIESMASLAARSRKGQQHHSSAASPHRYRDGGVGRGDRARCRLCRQAWRDRRDDDPARQPACHGPQSGGGNRQSDCRCHAHRRRNRGCYNQWRRHTGRPRIRSTRSSTAAMYSRSFPCADGHAQRDGGSVRLRFGARPPARFCAARCGWQRRDRSAPAD